MKVTREPIELVIFNLESTYLRFEGDFWYKYDENTDAYTRVIDPMHLEVAYRDAENLS